MTDGTPTEKRSKRQRAAAVAAAIRASVLGAGVLVLFVLLVIVNYLGWKYHARFDWTASDVYTLSETTERVLAELDEEDRSVRVTAFVTPDSLLYEPTRELLARYEALSPNLEIRWFDRERNPVEAAKLVQEYGVSVESVVFEMGDERRIVEASELADFEPTGGFDEIPEIEAFRGEERFTSALVALTQGDKPRVLFTTGHGELSLDDGGAGGLTLAREILGPENVEVEEWRPLGASQVPEGTDLVVVAGPQGSFSAGELSILGAFLAEGGRLLLLLDPVIAPGGDSPSFADLGFQEWLADYGAHLGDDVVIDDNSPMGFSAETFYVTRYERQEITRVLADTGISALVRQARSVRAGSGPEGTEVVELMHTGPDGWALTSLDRESFEPGEGDVRGPVSLAVSLEARVAARPAAASEGAEAGAAGEAEEEAETEAGAPDDLPRMRMVVIGDSDFASSAFLGAETGNQILLNNVFNWLVDREALVGIPPKRPEQVRLSMTRGEYNWTLLLVLAGLPGLAIAAGFWVWSRRRRVR